MGIKSEIIIDHSLMVPFTMLSYLIIEVFNHYFFLILQTSISNVFRLILYKLFFKFFIRLIEDIILINSFSLSYSKLFNPRECPNLCDSSLKHK